MDAVEKEARDLFDCARAGDQNAMKQLVAIRDKAVAGDQAMRRAYDRLMAYGHAHPLGVHGDNSGVSSTMGAEERHALGILRAADQNDPRAVMAALHQLPKYGHPDTVRAACVALAYQQAWTDPRLFGFEGLLPDEPRRSIFRNAVRVAPDRRRVNELRGYIPESDRRETDGTLCAGYCFGTARKFQLARLPKSPVSIMGADIGWECGEDPMDLVRGVTG
jgi:hypothetical protein